jgi:hypothetical protein
MYIRLFSLPSGQNRLIYGDNEAGKPNVQELAGKPDLPVPSDCGICGL